MFSWQIEACYLVSSGGILFTFVPMITSDLLQMVVNSYFCDSHENIVDAVGILSKHQCLECEKERRSCGVFRFLHFIAIN